MSLFSPDRRRLTIASLLMLFGAVLHTIGNLAPPPDPGVVEVRRVMQNYHLALGLWMSPSMWDIQRSLVFTMSLCLAGIASFGLVVAGNDAAPSRLIISIARVGLAISASLTALFAVYRVPPPLITFVVITIAYVFAAIGRPRPDER